MRMFYVILLVSTLLLGCDSDYNNRPVDYNQTSYAPRQPMVVEPVYVQQPTYYGSPDRYERRPTIVVKPKIVIGSSKPKEKVVYVQKQPIVVNKTTIIKQSSPTKTSYVGQSSKSSSSKKSYVFSKSKTTKKK